MRSANNGSVYRQLNRETDSGQSRHWNVISAVMSYPYEKLTKMTPTKMTPTKLPPIKLTVLRADERSDDGAVILTLATKYGGERNYSAPVACFNSLISDLQKLQLIATAPVKPAAPATTATAVTPGTAATPAQNLNQVAIRAPKKWMVRWMGGSGLPQPMVLVIIDPQTEGQAGYAFDAKSARELAAGLVENADALAAHEAKKH
jgi:hypothetical protein